MTRRLRQPGDTYRVDCYPFRDDDLEVTSWEYPTLEGATLFAKRQNFYLGIEVVVFNKFGNPVIRYPFNASVNARAQKAWDYPPDGTGVHSSLVAWQNVKRARRLRKVK
jgi:hypothetical protein